MKAATVVALLALIARCNSLNLHEEPAKKHPVSKVVTLLKEMQANIEKEAELDEEVYDKMACWCLTNDKEKTQAILDAEAKITDLTSEIERLAAKSAKLKVEIASEEEAVAKMIAALEKAAALRAKQAAEFTAEEKEMLSCIKALKDAVTVLAKHHPKPATEEPAKASLTQEKQTLQGFLSSLPPSFQNQIDNVRYQMSKHRDMLLETLTLDQRKMIGMLLQRPSLLAQPDDYFDAEPTFKQSYAPQSGQIFGILQQLKEDFENSLTASQKEELANQEAYVELKAAKETEIAAGQETIAEKKTELAETDEKLAQAKEDLEDTNNSLNADQKFLMDLKVRCALTDKEWEQRQKSRKEELEAVAKAIEILTSDEARELFSKTFNPEFLQTPALLQVSSNTARLNRRDQAARLLFFAGKRQNSQALEELAAFLKLADFTRVKKAIDDMVAQLLKEKADEIAHRDFCKEGLNENVRTTDQTTWDKKNIETHLEDLTITIETLDKELETLKSEIVDLEAQIKKAKADRELEHQEFLATVSDQQATQKLVGQALAALKSFYDPNGKFDVKLAQVAKHQKQGPPPPPSFEAYGKNEASGGVMGMLQQIINDAKSLEAEALKDEQKAQESHVSFLDETRASIRAKKEGITNKMQDKAKAEADKITAETKKEEIQESLDGLSKEKEDLHGDCDYILKNFEVRQAARDQEVEALRQAKAILSGAQV